VPIVFDHLNMDEQVAHHFDSYGFYSDALADYIAFDLLNRLTEPEGQTLLAIRDPYAYRDRLTRPKVLIHAAGDEYFLPDAAQFYFHDQTVLKVMFTAIVVTMLLLLWAAALDLIHLSQIFVNPTYLWPGIIGGLLVGFGFIVGGYCPGTSLVATGTGKIDGVWFILGMAGGVFLFGETVELYRPFYDTSGFMGRYVLPDWLGLDT
ncbi:MAG: YeeE/YedE family protein, partial [Phycisphaeraceae bacterium]|nr:YeeE/YedE family protein [Phycisphaeraceae bacterium]